MDMVLRCFVSVLLNCGHAQLTPPSFLQLLSVDFSSDSEWLLTASTDNTMCLWDAKKVRNKNNFDFANNLVCESHGMFQLCIVYSFLLQR